MEALDGPSALPQFAQNRHHSTAGNNPVSWFRLIEININSHFSRAVYIRPNGIGLHQRAAPILQYQLVKVSPR
jgi:hypothetical protein